MPDSGRSFNKWLRRYRLRSGLKSDIEFEWKLGLSVHWRRNQHVANRVGKPDCDRESIIMKAAIKVDFGQPITSLSTVSRGQLPRATLTEIGLGVSGPI